MTQYSQTTVASPYHLLLLLKKGSAWFHDVIHHRVSARPQRNCRSSLRSLLCTICTLSRSELLHLYYSILSVK